MQPLASTLEVGTSFNSIQEVKDACKAYSIKNAFEFRIVKADKDRYTIACKDKECTWRLHASSVKGSSIYRIKTYEPEHTCFGIHHTGHANADYAFLADKIADKVKEQPSYRPVDIVRDIQREMGVKISYSTAYRAKEHANEINNGTHDAAYQSLPKYCEDILSSNPNSVAILEKTPDDKFYRLFICYGACATGFIESFIVALCLVLMARI
jgi:zinc finger SWIM domain-containing protein 3